MVVKNKNTKKILFCNSRLLFENFKKENKNNGEKIFIEKFFMRIGGFKNK